MKSQVICDALNTVNPTSSQIARMRAALEAQQAATNEAVLGLMDMLAAVSTN